MSKISGKKLLCAAVALAIIGSGACYFAFAPSDNDRETFRTDVVKKGDVVRVIDATGTVEPEELVDVTARVSGEIVEFGRDTDGRSVDFGSRIKEGELIALIDDTIPQSNYLQCSAKLEQARAARAQAQANLDLANTNLKQAMRNWNRAKKLSVPETLSQSAYDNYLSEKEKCEASVGVAKTAIAAEDAAILQAEAAMKEAKRNLEYCTIKAPVDGVVIDRKVSVGQTVVSNMSASSLFLIAKDLKKMQVWASVNEADIGSIFAGQKVSFTVDAFPNEIFKGVVNKIRLNATMSQNVVTYVVEVNTDNSSGRLMPYLTANLNFEVARADNALYVPNAALRWTPESSAATPKPADGLRRLWVLDSPESAPRAVDVKVLLDAGTESAVEGAGLKEGAVVVTGVQTVAEAKKSKAKNPFMPSPPRRNKSGNSAPKK